MLVARAKSLLQNLVWAFSGGSTPRGVADAPEDRFGEDSILQQLDPVARCPRTGVAIEDSPHEKSCMLDDGSCSELASNGIRVACLREPHCLAQERRKAA